MSDLKKTFLKPGVNAGVSALALSMLTGPGEKYFDFMGKRIPVYLLGAGLGAASSFGVEVISNWVLPQIPGNKKFAHLESMVLHIAGSAGIFVGAVKLMNGNLNYEEGKKFAAAGALSEVVSTYLYENFLGK